MTSSAESVARSYVLGVIDMKITREWVNIVTPEHERTSCSDDNLYNASGGWEGKYNPNTGKKVIYYPRCNRCYLLDNVGLDLEVLDFAVTVHVELLWKDKS